MAQSDTLNTNTYNNSCFWVDWSVARSNGTKVTLNYAIGISVWNWAHWQSNAVVVGDVYIANTRVTTGGTWSNINYNPYTGKSIKESDRITLLTGTVEIIVNYEGKADFNIKFNGWLYANGNIYKEQVFSLDGINVTPTVSISKISNNATTIKIKCSDTNGVNSEKYHIYNGNTFLKETTSKEITLENLTPNTKYSIKAYGYGNGGFGPESNTLYITTSKQSTITSIGDFSINGVKLTLSGEGNIVVIIDGKEVVRRNKVPAGEYELVLTDDEKQEIYKLMGNNNSINAIIRVETSGTYVDKNISITLTGDVFSCTLKINGANKKCKVWVGTTSGNKQGIFTIGTSNGNVRGR